MIVERRPGTEIVPAKVGGQAEKIGRVFTLGRPRLQHGVVDADVFALGIKFGERLRKIACPPGSGDLLQIGRSLRKVLTQGPGQRARTPEEHATVTVVDAGGGEPLRFPLVWFLQKTLDAEEVRLHLISGFNVTVTSLGPRRLNAHDCNGVFFTGDRERATDRFAELVFCSDTVAGGKQPQECPRGLPFTDKRTQSDSGTGLRGSRLRTHRV